MATNTKDRYDLTTYNNVDYERDFVFKDNGVLRPWTNYTAKLQIRDAPGATALVTLTDSAGITFGPGDGALKIIITKAQLQTLTVGVYEYDLILSLSGSPKRAFGGKVFVTAGITV